MFAVSALAWPITYPPLGTHGKSPFRVRSEYHEPNARGHEKRGRHQSGDIRSDFR
jgi:hypothetical protein